MKSPAALTVPLPPLGEAIIHTVDTLSLGSLLESLVILQNFY